MENFEKITAKIILERIEKLESKLSIAQKYNFSENVKNDLRIQISENYLLASKLFNLEFGIYKVGQNYEIATNYFEVEKELNLIINS